MGIFAGIRAIVLLIINIYNRYETNFFYFFLNIIYTPIIILAILWTIYDTNTYILIPAFFIIQMVVIRKVRRMMKVRVGDTPAETRPLQKPSQVPLTLVTYDSSTSMSNFSGYSEFAIQRAQAGFKRRLKSDTLVAFGFFCLAFLWLLPGDKISEDPGTTAGIIALIGVSILSSVILRGLFMGRQYRPLDARYTDFLKQNPLKIYGEELANLLHRGGINVVIAGILLVGVVNPVTKNDWGSRFTLIAIGGIYFYLLLRPRPDPGMNVRLLLLRTFNIGRNSLFTFRRLVRFWEHVGNYFTVVDASFLQHKYRFLSRRTLVVMIILVGLTVALRELGMTVLRVPETDSNTLRVTLLAALLATVTVIMAELYMINRGFIKSRKEIRQRLKRLNQRPRGMMDFTFTGLPTMCHDNTWRGTVAEFVKRADVVLMDLRGFTEKKRGCRFEINFLLDYKPVNQVVILIDRKDNREYICSTLLELWQDLRTHSPNLNVKDPKIKIYICSDQDEEDVQGIFDILLAAANPRPLAEARSRVVTVS